MNPLLENIDGRLRAWSLAQADAAERAWPVLIARHTLRRAGYYESFPQLLMTAAANSQPEAEHEHLESTDYDLSPAVCYHAYAALENETLQEGGCVLAARGHCFRNEVREDLKPGRRQMEFQMRELVFVGSPEWLQKRLEIMQEEIALLAVEFAISGNWQDACDPFFLPKAEALGKARMQRLLKTKVEYCLPDGLAIASINRHGTFFGGRFDIRLPDGSAAHSACVAFGLERWATGAVEKNG